MTNETMVLKGSAVATNVPAGTYIFDGENYYFFSMVKKEGFVGMIFNKKYNANKLQKSVGRIS